jgi:hypothetical protein
MSCHAFHLHPLAVINDRPLNFKHETIDNDLLECFFREEVHVVTRGELALCEVSVPDKRVSLGKVLDDGYIAYWASLKASALHRWLFSHRIALTGDGADSQHHADRILSRIDALSKAA